MLTSPTINVHIEYPHHNHHRRIDDADFSPRRQMPLLLRFDYYAFYAACSLRYFHLSVILFLLFFEAFYLLMTLLICHVVIAELSAFADVAAAYFAATHSFDVAFFFHFHALPPLDVIAAAAL